MLYSNIYLTQKNKDMEWGTLHRFEIGEEGRGRCLISLPCPESLKEIEVNNVHKNITIGKTKTDRPRIIMQEDFNMYLILTSEGGYTRRGDGRVQCLETQKSLIEIIATGNGADGAAGRIGTWDCCLIKVLNNTTPIFFRVKPSGGINSKIYICFNQEVFCASLDQLEDLCEVKNININFTLTSECKLELNEWISI